uniref:UDP-N-acetylmuramate:L-alanyl-gamma-D-glutamyl-meso-diaminopimelate ligase n=1 Tax=Magnetococcus massalia (strain MO-1) TaxID=451514 RepID=A0A1S7LR41_MAGMO|nr:UDP-N-acetylmuramate:L-alanyl-gamma-D-glutamyl-meso-diaminopimelate ligase [Candidatus Magnetococcus massalia]CRH08261.1 UDP-N-acetylmuramate:L-alanyl-gamma-D-glutamyl-meso-diaminopimelate ligase [Candidatus Magnetococcus massalia]CRH08328.1 UDP-N-acetylmuramate:L-alanyl-gamma-D-glutamyl-meso-diaminopimelate ligase [Candidatus Magnetococcus massalia]
MKHLHIIGICGTAMANLAALAKADGWHVTGSDAGVYPPMSTFLEDQDIELQEGFRAENLQPAPDLTLVGNAISRGNPELEALMAQGLPYTSGAAWFHDHVLAGRHPIVVSGTHGKTTTTSMMAKVWEEAGWQPGFLIGGIPADFGQGSRFPQSQWVTVEGDEYDTAFFDKRPKFLHYRPRTLILNNLEFDHADIYADLEAIRVQFRLLLRTVPPNGLVLANWDEPEIRELAAQAYSPVVSYGLEEGATYRAELLTPEGSQWRLLRDGEPLVEIHWGHFGRHNVSNALAVCAAALEHGMNPEQLKVGLERYQGVARRLQVRAKSGGVTLYDDFAHHPTAITTTLQGLRDKVGQGARIWAILEPRSNTMRRRIHQERLAQALAPADRILIARPASRGLADDDMLDVHAIAQQLSSQDAQRARVVEDAEEVMAAITPELAGGDEVLVMSNGGFGGLHLKLADWITTHFRRSC